jgi:hypothetical protein
MDSGLRQNDGVGLDEKTNNTRHPGEGRDPRTTTSND